MYAANELRDLTECLVVSKQPDLIAKIQTFGLIKTLEKDFASLKIRAPFLSLLSHQSVFELLKKTLQ